MAPKPEYRWCVYILQSTSTTSLYTGISSDVVRRVQAHNSNKGAKFTRGKGPWKVAYMQGPLKKGDALRRELEIKAMTRAKKLELLREDFSLRLAPQD